MAIDMRDAAAGEDAHVVKFYENDAELVQAVAPYLAAAIRADEVVVVIATGAHRRAFESVLDDDGLDLEQARADGRLLCLDAAATMSTFTTNAKIDRGAFREIIGGVIRCAAATGRPVRAYGEMVALLWDAGDVLAAIELEMLWNELARELPFSLFCSYPTASVAGSEYADALHHVCDLHSSVLSPSGDDEAQGSVSACAQTGISAAFPGERDSPGRARRLVVDALRRWGAREALVNDVALVVSELSTNAVRHARSPFSVTVRAHGATLHVAIQDGQALLSTLPDGGLVPQPLHGLSLIDGLSNEWGFEDTHEGKVVWAELHYETSHASRDAHPHT